MRHAIIDAWLDVWWSIKDALWTSAAGVLGKRSHGGKMVSLGPYRWFPGNYPTEEQEGEQ